jgi:hypothetical protein
MLFTELSIDDITKLVDLAARVVTKGEIVLDDPVFKRWCEVCGFNSNRLLVMSTVFPSKALVSVVQHFSPKNNPDT